MEAVCPLFWSLNPPERGLIQSKDECLGRFKVYYIYYGIYIIMTYRLHAIHIHSYLLQYTDFERHQKHADMQIYSIYVYVFTWGQSTEPQTQELQAGRQRLLQRGESVDVMIDFSPYDILWLQFFIEELGCYISGRFWYVSWESWPLKHLYWMAPRESWSENEKTQPRKKIQLGLNDLLWMQPGWYSLRFHYFSRLGTVSEFLFWLFPSVQYFFW